MIYWWRLSPIFQSLLSSHYVLFSVYSITYFMKGILGFPFLSLPSITYSSIIVVIQVLLIKYPIHLFSLFTEYFTLVSGRSFSYKQLFLIFSVYKILNALTPYFKIFTYLALIISHVLHKTFYKSYLLVLRFIVFYVIVITR